MVRTCDSCPTQYDLFFSGGGYGYFRYRHGRWSLELFESPEAFWGGQSLAAVGDTIGDRYDGFLEHSEVMGLLEHALPELLAQVGDVAPADVRYEGFHLGQLYRITYDDSPTRAEC